MAIAKDLHSKLLPFSKFLYIFRKSHQIWLNYLSPSLSYGRKTSRVVPNTPPGRIGLRYLKTLYPPQDITLKQLTLKTTTLLCLLTGQRSHTMHRFDTQFIQKHPNMYRVTVQEKLKHTEPGRHQEPFEYLPYEPDKAFCIYEHLSEYIDRTKLLRDCSKLLISDIRPHKAVSKDTGTLVKSNITLGFSGIDTEKFTAHSYRVASTSSNKAAGLNLTEILKTAGWSNVQMFAKYYNKPLESVNYGSKLRERSEI